MAGIEVEPLDSILAYPLGRFRQKPDLGKGRRLGAAARAKLQQWWRVGLTAESYGAMQSALDFTVEYVTQRRLFGRQLGSFQAVQHRLAKAAELTQGIRWLALRAAWSRDPGEAAMAATYAQTAIPQVAYDLHQFNGAMGLTLEHPLHYWTYRLKTLQGELGGSGAQALATADALWGPAAA
jgi:alkylation response protein AidB-like acyl-CoA dehydrogenase